MFPDLNGKADLVNFCLKFMDGTPKGAETATSSFSVKQERREEKEQRGKLKTVEEQRVKGGGREVGTFHRLVSLSAEQSKAAAWCPSLPEHPLHTLARDTQAICASINPAAFFSLQPQTKFHFC